MSVSGTWKLTMNTPFGVQTPTLDISSNSDNYSGTLTGATGTSELEDLTVNGSQVSFTTKVATPMGQFPVSFDATVDGDAMNGTFKTMMGKTEFSGVRQ